jgi:hypothetical protein
MVNKAFISPKFKKQINKQNSYLLLAFLQSGSVPELDMHESKHFLPGPFVHSVPAANKETRPRFQFTYNVFVTHTLHMNIYYANQCNI